MHFDFDDDQIALRDVVRRFCSHRLDLSRVGEREGAPADDVVWHGLTELGVFTLLEPDAGSGPVEATVVLEELGRHLTPGPVLWTVLVAPLVGAVDEPTGVSSQGTPRLAGLDAVHHHGPPVVIEHAAEAHAVVICHDDRVELVPRSELGPGIAGSPIDPLTPAMVVGALPGGRVIGVAETARSLRLAGTLLAAASLVGVAQGALDVARAYALERVQFDRPIGSFQAVKHLLADMHVRVELARAETYAAAAMSADPRAGDAEVAAAAAKLLAGEAGLGNARAAVQVLGGMGFTWDMLPHYYLKRAWVLEHAFGTGSWHAERIGTAVGVEVDRG